MMFLWLGRGPCVREPRLPRARRQGWNIWGSGGNSGNLTCQNLGDVKRNAKHICTKVWKGCMMNAYWKRLAMAGFNITPLMALP